MNYSTAKTILFLYRKKLKIASGRYDLRHDSNKESCSSGSSGSEQASYRVGKQHLEISSSIGGNCAYGVVKVCSYRGRLPNDRPV